MIDIKKHYYNMGNEDINMIKNNFSDNFLLNKNLKHFNTKQYTNNVIIAALTISIKSLFIISIAEYIDFAYLVV